MINLSYLSCMRLSGVDAGSFLHNQVSADVLALTSSNSTFACYCEPKGRVLALMLIQKVKEDYYVVMSSSLITAVAERLKIYVMRSKVTIEVLGEHWVAGIMANNASELALTSAPSIRLPSGSHWLVVSPLQSATDEDITTLEKWKMSELRLGITWLSPETSGQFLPQMLGFEELGAVNYRKGCYPGQEIVARTHYLGKVKRHPRLLICKLKNNPQTMDKIKLFSHEQTDEAIIADCGSGDGGRFCILVVTRLEADAIVERIEYMGEITKLY